MSGWSTWTRCIPDKGICGLGIKARFREKIEDFKNNKIYNCPLLKEMISCFKECPWTQKRGKIIHYGTFKK